MIQSASPAAIVATLNRKFTAGDSDGALALLSPDIVVEQPASLPHGGRHEGLDAMGQAGARFAEHWTREISAPTIYDTNALVELDEPKGATAVQVTTQTWTSIATGKSATVDVVELFTVADGLIIEIRVFQHDTATLLSTLEA